ncbi:Hsp20/alpha crystallin family protein [Thermomicrobium sp. 4228-Ro]|uniref:Hsp20/alpha crystallin family protein n=1 Tax=Thermomicrobium sp. 4228-Ro TaxID=2993937 RepID=UPI00224906E7|nr:Hsp20/alpha crystallin family protein [Thermomicrobium sp. 4228-Ro]MCX2727471.1 Hsp20/alpha crystallin family protein [Thermomicrobium sp. 4228-Ro]
MSGGRTFDPWFEGSPWREFVEQFFGVPAHRPAPTVSGIGVPVDIAELGDAYVVYAVIPGIDPTSVDLQVEDDRLVLRGEIEEPEIEGQWVSRERRYGRFQRTVVLPGPVDPEGAEARYERGVLIVRLPKASRARARRIPVRGG